MEVDGRAAQAEDLLLLGKRGGESRSGESLMENNLQLRRGCPMPSIDTDRFAALCEAAASPVCRPIEPEQTHEQPAQFPATRLLALRPLFEMLGMTSFDGVERLAKAELAEADQVESHEFATTASSEEEAPAEPQFSAKPPSEGEGSSFDASAASSVEQSPSCMMSTSSDVAMSMLMLANEPSPGPSQLQRLKQTDHRIDLAALEQPTAGADTPPTAPASRPSRSFE